MSCVHGNWPPCSECDVIDDAYRQGFAAGKAEALALPGAGSGEVDCVKVASFVEKAASILSGSPFPSGRSYFKARQIADLALIELTASPAQDDGAALEDAKDAARYRWLRDLKRVSEGVEECGIYIGIESRDFWCLAEDIADASIDAAMLAASPADAGKGG